MKKGFTLIELLVVVLIIGILASVALPQYQKAVNKAKTVEAIETMAFVEREQNLSYLANGYVDESIYNASELPALKYFRVGSGSGGNYADSFLGLTSNNDDIMVVTYFSNGKSHRYCSGKCTMYFTAENCADSSLSNDAASIISAAKCKLM